MKLKSPAEIIIRLSLRLYLSLLFLFFHTTYLYILNNLAPGLG